MFKQIIELQDALLRMAAGKSRPDGGVIGAELFREPSDRFCRPLAVLAADLCDRSERMLDLRIKKAYADHGIRDCRTYRYLTRGGAFIIGRTELVIDGEPAAVIIVTLRGSKTLSEFLGDLIRGGTVDFLGTKVYRHIYEFYRQIPKCLAEYRAEYGIAPSDRVRYLITGHSLGGAAAGLLTARLNTDLAEGKTEWGNGLRREDIYCYTFGAITTVMQDENVEQGYENIHNIYNYYDSYGEHGVHAFLRASSSGRKFGHTDLFGNSPQWFDKYRESPWNLFVSRHHWMNAYLDAVSHPEESGLESCSGEQ